MMTASFTAAWYTPRVACHWADDVSKKRNSTRSRKSLATPGSAAIISGSEYTSILLTRAPSHTSLSRTTSGTKSRRQSTQLTRMAKMGYVKSGWAGHTKNSTRLAPVSVRIFTVLRTANFTALCSCLNLAKRMAVMLSQKRMAAT